MTPENTSDTPSPISLSKKALLTRLAAGLGVATLIAFAAVLPAEFNYDPLGVGKALGLTQISENTAAEQAAPDTTSIAHSYATPFRSDSIDIPLAADGEFVDGRSSSELEYKVKMQKGATLVYSWTVEGGTPGEFYFDFHGESPPNPTPQVLSYQADLGDSGHGSLVAPFDGIHGWYLQNQSIKPAVVHLKMSGFYELHDMSQPLK